MRELTIDEMAEIRGGDLEGFLCDVAFTGFGISQSAWLYLIGAGFWPMTAVLGGIALTGAVVCNFLNS